MPLSDDEKGQLISEAKAMWDSASQLHQIWEDRWAKNERLVNSQHLTTRKAGQSSLFIPKIEGFHQSKMSDHLAAFGGNDPVSLKKTATSTKNGASIMEYVVNYYISDAGGISWDSYVVNAASNALTYNFAPAIIDWDRDVREEEIEVDIIDEDGEPARGKEKVETELFSHPTIELIPPEDFRIDPSVGWDELRYARYGACRFFRDQAFAEQMAKQGVWPEIEESEFGIGFTNDSGTLKNERAMEGSPFNDSTDIDNGLIEVRKYWFYHDLGDGMVPVEMTTLDDRIILEDPSELELDFSNSDGSDPFNFEIARIYIKPHEPITRAMPDKLEQLQIEQNSIRNQRRDNIGLILNPEKLVTANTGIDPAVLSRSFVGKVSVVRNINDVRWERPPDVTSSAYNEEQVTVNDMERLVAESAQKIGAEPSRKETATASKIQAAGGAKTVGFDAAIFGMTGPEAIVRKLIRAIRQAAPESIFILAAEHLQIESADPFKEAVTGDFRVRVGAGQHQAAIDLQISNASNTAAIIQSIYGNAANYHEIIAPMLEAQGFNPDEVIPNPKEQLDPNSPILKDAGGVQDNVAPLTPQPVVQLQGGQFGQGSGGQSA